MEGHKEGAKGWARQRGYPTGNEEILALQDEGSWLGVVPDDKAAGRYVRAAGSARHSYEEVGVPSCEAFQHVALLLWRGVAGRKHSRLPGCKTGALTMRDQIHQPVHKPSGACVVAQIAQHVPLKIPACQLVAIALERQARLSRIQVMMIKRVS